MASKPAVYHGGNLGEAKRMAPDWHGAWIDLSTGINPWPYPISELEGEIWTRLPRDDLIEAARQAARSHYGAPPEAAIIPAPGSQSLIQWLPRLRSPGRVVVAGPTYGEHAHCWRLAGHDVDVVDEPSTAADEANVVVVTNPNNPDGREWRPDELRAVAERLASREGWLVVDEAFADLRPEISLAPFAGAPGICVLRSVGKFFGLAGLRLGFLIASDDIGDRIAAALGPWAVSGPALAVGAAALADTSWIASTRVRLAQAADALAADLEGFGFEIIGGTDLFKLVAHDRAEEVFDRLLQKGILVRRFPDLPRLLRFGLPSGEAERDRLGKVLGTIAA